MTKSEFTLESVAGTYHRGTRTIPGATLVLAPDGTFEVRIEWCYGSPIEIGGTWSVEVDRLLLTSESGTPLHGSLEDLRLVVNGDWILLVADDRSALFDLHGPTRELCWYPDRARDVFDPVPL